MSEMGMAMMGTGVAKGEGRARTAAEKAIRSPLLEDVNLEGARGILVNITASESLGLGEFSEVGDTIEEFASENATVVVGTVIDPELGDEIRVTVVATGIGQIERPVKVVDNSSRRVQPRADGSVDYGALDRPPAMRRPAIRGSVAEDRYGRPESVQSTYPSHEAARKAVAPAGDELEYLDIPAFLRRQAD
jgi:cell division protein FtsZ